MYVLCVLCLDEFLIAEVALAFPGDGGSRCIRVKWRRRFRCMSALLLDVSLACPVATSAFAAKILVLSSGNALEQSCLLSLSRDNSKVWVCFLELFWKSVLSSSAFLKFLRWLCQHWFGDLLTRACSEWGSDTTCFFFFCFGWWILYLQNVLGTNVFWWRSCLASMWPLDLFMTQKRQLKLGSKLSMS